MTTKKRITLEDVSRAAGVSLSTASMILNGRPDVSFSPDTVQNVRHTADVLGYRSPARHRAKPLSSRRLVLIVSPNIGNAYYSSMVQAIQQAAEQRGVSTLIFTTYREAAKEDEILDMAMEMGASGIVFTMMPQSTLLEKVNRSIPIVAVGDRNTSLNVDTVELDNYSAGMLVGRHMLSLGHRHIAFISTTLNSVNSMRVRRLDGVRAVYAEEEGTSVQVFSRDITPLEELNDIGIEHRVGYELTMECLKRHTHISGIVAVNDSVAYGVLDALSEKGLRVPEDYSVCGFDNLFTSHFRNVGLTSVEHHIEEKGRNAFHILYERMTGSIAPNNITRVEFSHHLRENRSTAPFQQRREKN
ncbi:LacI family DNA-binding transcriptional regulator [Mailhella massiliensis]|uniref:LacI family transcriptional regulator n=1 Tax=Mailhella massiliensis TaxID=1903261 RepID=A0A921AX57_9BACT|nr:LacI family DNA-binding transcriptional regulator [Mailhella massiliensis]HJD97676.1 LacI family transcriptional regulator [Mailhella massiliensis]